jgi:hypothetical protein
MSFPHEVFAEYLLPTATGYFVRNDAYASIIEKVRDFEYAPQAIGGFKNDIGSRYQLWTKQAYYDFHATCFAEPGDQIQVSVTLDKHQPKKTLFYLQFVVHDGKWKGNGSMTGVYATCRQAIACQEVVHEEQSGSPVVMKTVGWPRIEPIRKFVNGRFE